MDKLSADLVNATQKLATAARPPPRTSNPRGKDGLRLLSTDSIDDAQLLAMAEQQAAVRRQAANGATPSPALFSSHV